MRGVDLTLFDFDYDLTWAAFFTNANGHVYGRYGSREEGSAEAGLSLKGLKYAMNEALKAYANKPDAQPEKPTGRNALLPKRAELYPAAKRLKADACIHCHQVHNFKIDWLWSRKKWTKDEMWLYPPTKNVGIHLNLDQGDQIQKVDANSAAAAAGLQAGDVLRKLNGIATSSEADVRYGLNRAPKSGTISVSWTRNGREMSGVISLKKGWRKSDNSWRASMWTMPPAMGIYGKDLTVQEKRRLGLGPKRLAFRQGRYVPRRTRQAGIRGGDIIIGVNGKPLEMKMLQFNLYMRENFNVGDKVVFDVIRGRRRMRIPMTLPRRPNQ